MVCIEVTLLYSNYFVAKKTMRSLANHMVKSPARLVFHRFLTAILPYHRGDAGREQNQSSLQTRCLSSSKLLRRSLQCLV